MGWRVLFGLGAHQVGQRGDAVVGRQSIMQIGPEADAQFSTGLLETYERVAAATAQITSRSGADLSQPGIFADVVFGQVVMQRQMGIVQHGQELICLGMQQGQRRVQVWIGCLGQAERVACFLAPAILLLRLAEQLQKVQSRLGVGGAEAGEQLVADVRANCRFALVPRWRVIAMQVAADFPADLAVTVEVFAAVDWVQSMAAPSSLSFAESRRATIEFLPPVAGSLPPRPAPVASAPPREFLSRRPSTAAILVVPNCSSQ